MFVQWDSESIPLFYTKELGITGDLYDSSVKVEFTSITNHDIIKYFNCWHNSDDTKKLILTWETNNKRNFYLFENSFPNIISIDIQGNLSSFKLKFKSCKNITRKYKINLLLSVN